MMNIEQRRKLPTLLKHFNLPMIAVEVGVAGGSFSQELLEWGIEKIYCVDNWAQIKNVTGDGSFPNDFHEKSFKEYRNRFGTLFKDNVTTLRGLSSEMHKHIPDNSLGLVYLDGGHQYEIVKQDINSYVPKLVAGGIIGFHDYYNSDYGVKQAVDEFATSHGLAINEIPEENPYVASVWIRIN